MAENTPSISRGMLVDCIVTVDEDKRSIDVRRAKVFRVDAKGVILSQTNPAIPESAKGSKLVVTFLDAKNNRMGFSAVISQITTHYQLSAEHKVGAVLLTNLTEEKQQNLRMAFRVRLAENTGLTLYNSQKEALEMIDLSGSGARFTHDLKNEYKVGQRIKLYLGYERVFYELKAEVVRKGDSSGAEVKNREQVAVRFLDLDLRTEDEIYKMVRNIEIRKASPVVK
jgi:hypothetical protein